MWVRALGANNDGFLGLVSEASPKHVDAFFVRLAPAVQKKLKASRIKDVREHFDQQYIRATGKVKIIAYTGIGKRAVIDIDAVENITLVDPEPAYPVDPAIVELAKSGNLFQKHNYKDVRAAFARRFEKNHEAQIKQAFGTDYEALN